MKAIVGQLYSRFLAEIHRAGIVVGRRFQFCIAVLSIALQAADLCVGGWGHRHEHFGIDDSENAALADSCGHECHHHDHDGLTDESDGQIPADSHDDCSLCRHFSQPVAPVAVELPAVACEHVAPLFARLISTEGISAEIRHPARGPPAFVA